MNLSRWIRLAVLTLALLAPSQLAVAQASEGLPAFSSLVTEFANASASAADEAPVGETGSEASEERRLSTAVEIAVLLTVLSLLPAVLISITSFTRIVIVLSFVRRALSVNELPPNPVIIGLALFLTTFVMAPIAERIYETAYVPYKAGEMESEVAAELAWTEMRGFLVANTRESELALFAEMSRYEGELQDPADLPFSVVVPAFVLSELKTAFQMGFLLFLPFLVIDLVVSSILLSMGMFMLPPVMISTPFKILVFVLVDGWHLVCHSVVSSFIAT